MKHKATVMCLFTMAVLALVATLGAQARSEGDSPFRQDGRASTEYNPAAPADGCRSYGEQLAEQIFEDCDVSLPPGGGPTPPDTFDTLTATDSRTLKDALTALGDQFGRVYRRVMSEQQQMAIAIYRLRGLQRLTSTLPGYFTEDTGQTAGKDADDAASEMTPPPPSGVGGSAYQKIEVPEAITWAGDRAVSSGQPVMAASTWREFEVALVASDSALVKEAPTAAPLR